MADTTLELVMLQFAIVHGTTAHSIAVCSTVACDAVALLYSDGSVGNFATLHCSDGSVAARGGEEVKKLFFLKIKFNDS
jgi:hypothetical protein